MADDFSDDEIKRDLFGNPSLPIRDRRGRKSFRKDKENQDFVMARAADGWSQKRIAEDMGIDEKTLRKYFSRELEYGPTFVRGMMLDVLMKRAREGHVPSIKLLADWHKDAGPQAPRNARPDKGAEKDEDGEEAPSRLGKKEREALEAQDVPDNYGEIFDRMSQHRH
ncbi:helix-turn-helix domain-containing protein [Martelella alba]|uniref:Helix-turn-helix domain-containing protein n=1 Tax=Martelella alba TaxID=2590451 RepID=A0A506U668_9HYPH|nr:helix-turn-helix domain-containing protein [Martelella alba]TPW28601.1 helix-turn-helix domain-containing protein [Martelella alba]